MRRPGIDARSELSSSSGIGIWPTSEPVLVEAGVDYKGAYGIYRTDLVSRIAQGRFVEQPQQLT
jgi:hypothetical protein